MVRGDTKFLSYDSSLMIKSRSYCNLHQHISAGTWKSIYSESLFPLSGLGGYVTEAAALCLESESQNVWWQHWCSPWAKHRWALQLLGMNSARRNLCHELQESWKHLLNLPGSCCQEDFLCQGLILQSGTLLWAADVSAAASAVTEWLLQCWNLGPIQPHRAIDAPAPYLQRI